MRIRAVVVGALFLSALYGQAPALAGLPLSFEANKGQTDPRVQYLVRGNGQSLFFTGNQAVLSLRAPEAGSSGRFQSAGALESRGRRGASIRMSLRGSRPADSIEAMDPLPGKVNYLMGNDPSKWRTDIPTFGRIAYQGVYPGVDLVYYGTEGRLEYDFVARPGADAGAIQVQFEGAGRIRLDEDGDLLLDTAAGPVRWKKPYVYQDDHGVRRPIAASYRLKGDQAVSFQLAAYNSRLPVVIDPVLVYATYLGGSGAELYAGAFADATGIYAAGTTYSANFPASTGAWDTSLSGSYDIFATKLNPQGSAVLYSTYIGGSALNSPNAALLGTDGSVYLSGFTTSTDFPTTASAYKRIYGTANETGFVTRLSATFNSLVFSTYLGGSYDDDIFGMANDASGNIYVAGVTSSVDYPVTSGAPQPYFGGGDNDAFVTKLNSTGSGLVYSTYLGGSRDEEVLNPSLGTNPPQIQFLYANVIAVDSAGAAYVAGVTDSCDFPTTSNAYQPASHCDAGDGYVTKINPGGTAWVYSTYLGGSGFDAAEAVIVDSTGSALVAGATGSADFPTTTGAYSQVYAGGAADAFAARLDPTGSTLTYSTLFGGGDQEAFVQADVAGNGNVMLSGLTYSSNLPTTSGAFQSAYGGSGDSFITIFDPTLSRLIDSTYLGTPALDVATARFATSPTDILVIGQTGSSAFPTTAGAYQRTYGGGASDDFIARFSLAATGPVLSITESHAGNFTQGQVGATYTISVSNALGAAPVASGATVTVTETAPSGLTLTSMAGSGWGCGGNTCTRSDGLAAGAPYPPITVTVNVAANAASPQVNSVTVSGGGSAVATATDSTIVNPAGGQAPALTITKSHNGSFAAGQLSAVYSVTVSNFGSASTSGTVMVTENAPLGLTLVSMAGTGWSCPSGGASCTRADALAVGSSYPAIAVTVNVAANATSPQVNGVTVSGGGSATASTTDTTVITGGTGGLALYPVTPCRVADTRNANGPFGGPIVPGGSTRNFAIPASACNIPSTALAYSLTVTAVPPGSLNYLTAWPTGRSQPVVSTLNSSNGAVIANAAIVPAGANGAISIYVSDTTHVVIDINGYFAAQGGAGGLAFYPANPCRVADTRNANGPFGGPSLAAGGTRSFVVPQSACGIPSTAQAYSFNMTAVPPGTLDYLTTWPTGQPQPYVSTLNAWQGQVVANAAIVPAGANGAISVFVSDASNVLVDINGYFAPPGGAGAVYFYPVTPCRIADTRTATGTFGGPLLGAGSTRTFPVPASACGLPSFAQAYSLNMTVVPPGSMFYLTTWPAGQAQPYVSTLNDLQGQVIANAAIVPAGASGGISVFVTDATNLVIDVNGYFGQ